MARVSLFIVNWHEYFNLCEKWKKRPKKIWEKKQNTHVIIKKINNVNSIYI